MINETFIEAGNQLKTALMREKTGGSGQRWRCPADLQARVVEYARARREVGATLSDVAQELGIGDSTLGRWVSRNKLSEGRFRSVAIVARGEGFPEPDDTDRYRLVSPKGYEVSDLDVRSLAYLLRVVG